MDEISLLSPFDYSVYYRILTGFGKRNINQIVRAMGFSNPALQVENVKQAIDRLVSGGIVFEENGKYFAKEIKIFKIAIDN